MLTKPASRQHQPATDRTPARRPVLRAEEYEKIFDVLDRCDSAADLAEFRSHLISAMSSAFNLSHVAFFSGPTLRQAFADESPIATGDRRGSLVREYQRTWSKYDVFASPSALSRLRSTGWVNLEQIRDVDSVEMPYIAGFLRRIGLESGGAFTFELPGSCCGLIGVFDPDPDALGARDSMAIQLLLQRARTIPYALRTGCGTRALGALPDLSPRQRDVVELVIEGLSNAQIAQSLGLAEDTVKKYVSRALATTGCRTRTQLAIRAINVR